MEMHMRVRVTAEQWAITKFIYKEKTLQTEVTRLRTSKVVMASTGGVMVEYELI
jgi:hypothetical protein